MIVESGARLQNMIDEERGTGMTLIYIYLGSRTCAVGGRGTFEQQPKKSWEDTCG